MLVVWAVGAAITYLMLSVLWFMESMGFVAVFTEAMLGEFVLYNIYICIYLSSNVFISFACRGATISAQL